MITEFLIPGLTIASLISFFSYVIYIWIKYGIHTSISASWYSLDRNKKWLFTAWTWGFAIPLTIAGMHLAVEGGGGALTFFSGAFIAFVGAAPRNWDGAKQFLSDQLNFKPYEKVIHKIAAYAGVLLIQVAILVEYTRPMAFLIVGIFVVTSALLLWRGKHAIWYIEILAYVLFVLNITFM